MIDIKLNLKMQTGYLEGILGPMGSGKSTELIRRARILVDTIETEKVVYVNTMKDLRTTDVFSSHNKDLKLPMKVDGVKLDNLMELDYTKWDSICVDEAHFFSDLVKAVDLWISKGKHVIICSLGGSWNMDPIGDIKELLGKFDDLVLLKAYCKMCAKSGKRTLCTFTARISDDDTEFVVGGMEAYIPMCRCCYESHCQTKKT